MAEDARKELEVRQLTVREAADLMDALFAPDGSGMREHAIDKLMAGRTEIPSALVFAATGTTYETFPLDIPPEDLPRLYEEVGRLNPFSAAAIKTRLERMLAALERLGAELNGAETPSGAPPSS